MLLSLSFGWRSLHLLARERITGLPTILRSPPTAVHCILLVVAWLDLTTPKMNSSHRFLAAGKQILFSLSLSSLLSCLFNARYLLRQFCPHLRLFPDKRSCLRNVRNYHLIECTYKTYNIHILYARVFCIHNNNNILLIHLYLGILTDSFQMIIPKFVLVLCLRHNSIACRFFYESYESCGAPMSC